MQSDLVVFIFVSEIKKKPKYCFSLTRLSRGVLLYSCGCVEEEEEEKEDGM